MRGTCRFRTMQVTSLIIVRPDRFQRWPRETSRYLAEMPSNRRHQSFSLAEGQVSLGPSTTLSPAANFSSCSFWLTT
ncbi:hypothetical protein CHELA1G2_11885 [Hyphomicrobiales bacterium]|nr:hypothetical protein CHELA1G2_11885 [Hyphomicrobiales bacterium]